MHSGKNAIYSQRELNYDSLALLTVNWPRNVPTVRTSW
jgi:hypothetical protein